MPPPEASPPDGALLAGVRVLDLSAYLSGPFAALQLGDLGAEVVKVEPPGGEPTRAGAAMTPGMPPSPFMLGLHRGRHGIVVDLQAPAGHDLFLQLVAEADVVVENFRPGITARLGITFADLQAVNARLVHCSITGYGPDGPAADLAAIDGPIQARAGIFDYVDATAAGGPAGSAPGAPLPMTVGDLAGATVATEGILAALYRRERTGRGCHLDVSLLESLLAWTAVGDRRRTLAPPVTLVGTGSDGVRFVVQTPMHFQDRLVGVVAAAPGCAHIGEDPRFATGAARRAHPAEYQAALMAAFLLRPAATWLEELHAAGVPAAAVQGFDQALEDPQVLHRGASVEVAPTGMPPVRVLASPVVADGRRSAQTAPPPVLGEHTAQVLRRWLGTDDAGMADLAEAGAFGAWRPS